MGLLSGLLNQTATYWALTGVDKFGSSIFSAPVSVEVRWEDKQEIVLTGQGEQRNTKSEVWVDQELTKNGFLLLGVSVELDPRLINEAFEIVDFYITSGLTGEDFVRKAIV